MNAKRTLLLSFALLGAFILAHCDGAMADRPDPGCEKSRDACVTGCDNAADTGKGANAYNACLKGCEKAYSACTKRQQQVGACAEAFQECISEAAGDEDAMDACRAAYRSCKGHN